MKKNAVGRILYQKEPIKRRISALQIPVRLLCLLLALFIWLVVTDLKRENDAPQDEDMPPYFEQMT
jgi:hypothetical protein